jgi:hypothetical protein
MFHGTGYNLNDLFVLEYANDSMSGVRMDIAAHQRALLAR